jgi:hypothetical protein
MLFHYLSLTRINIGSTKAVNNEKIEMMEFKSKLAFLSVPNSTLFSLWDEICSKKIHQEKKHREGRQEIIIIKQIS